MPCFDYLKLTANQNKLTFGAAVSFSANTKSEYSRFRLTSQSGYGYIQWVYSSAKKKFVK